MRQVRVAGHGTQYDAAEDEFPVATESVSGRWHGLLRVRKLIHAINDIVDGNDLLDLAAGLIVCLGDGHDQVHCFSDEVSLGGAAGCLYQLLDPGQAGPRGVEMGVCMYSANPAGMPSIPGF